jgi:hypothetical protein
MSTRLERLAAALFETTPCEIEYTAHCSNTNRVYVGSWVDDEVLLGGVPWPRAFPAQVPASFDAGKGFRFLPGRRRTRYRL